MTHDTSGRFRWKDCLALPGRSLFSIPDYLKDPALFSGSIVVGTIGWSGYVLALPITILFPALWAHARSRLVAGVVSAGYFLAASCDLPRGVANFYSLDVWPGLLLWVGASFGFVFVHTVLWTRRPGSGRALRYALAAVLMAIPPFGIVGWAHPLTAAGAIFPGWGWWGLGATAILLVVMTGRRWQIAVAVLGGLYVWSATTWTPPKIPDAWAKVDLALGQDLGRSNDLQSHRGLIATVLETADAGDRIVVLPESALGFWTQTVERLWRDGLRGSGITVIAGAAVIDLQGYDNVMMAVSGDESHVLYRERMPVPVSMWQPWRAWIGQNGGARATFFANPVIELDGKRIVPLICYEQLVVWPVLQSMLRTPDVIVAIGNGWWTAGTSIIAIQKASAATWARLFDIPVVIAFNN